MALTNKAKLFYYDPSATTTETTTKWIELDDLKEIPEFGIEAEKVENTCLADPIKLYDKGIGDAPELTYKFKYTGAASTTMYAKMKTREENKTLTWFADAINGTELHSSSVTTTTDVYYFQAYPSVKRTGGGVNEVVDWELTLVLADAPITTKPY